MKSNSIKNLAFVSAIALGFIALPIIAKAATTVQASVDTESAIDVQHVDDFNFNTWLIQVRASDQPTITMDHNGAMTTAATGTSTLENLTGGNGTPAELTVDLPDGSANTVLQMTHDAVLPQNLSGSVVGALKLSALSYTTAQEGDDVLFDGSGVDVTVLDGTDAEDVKFGATITATATPEDGLHTTSFNVSFAY